MYSKEDRERILADLGASGLPDSAFARIPGSPSRESLRKWRGRAEGGGGGGGDGRGGEWGGDRGGGGKGG